MNKDIVSTFLNSFSRVFSGPILLIFIPTYLSDLEQGYWYTFTSIAALSVFADLGFSTIVLQYSAHESTRLTKNANLLYDGPINALWKLSSLFVFVFNWLKRVIFFFFPIIVSIGYIFLQSKGDNVAWHLPWLMYSTSSGLLFVNSCVLSFFEGADGVAKAQFIRMIITFVNSLVSIFSLYIGLGLYSISIALLLSSATGSLLILYNFKNVIMQFFSLTKNRIYNWRPEFFRLLWRYAISWCSGYFVFQLFTPIAFKFYGPAFAGMIGISMAMWVAGYNIANSWLTAVIPRLNKLVSEQAWEDLDKTFNQALHRSLITMIVGGVSFFIIYHFTKSYIPQLSRILTYLPMSILFLCWLAQVYVNGLATYLRAHKKEPLMKLSFFSALYVVFSTIFCAFYLEKEYIFMGFFSKYFFTIPYAYNIYIKEKIAHKVV